MSYIATLTLVNVQCVLTLTPLLRLGRPQLPAEEIPLLVFLVSVRNSHRLYTLKKRKKKPIRKITSTVDTAVSSDSLFFWVPCTNTLIYLLISLLLPLLLQIILLFSFVFKRVIFLGLLQFRCGSLAEWLVSRTCDQQVAGSNPGRCAAECNSGRVGYTQVPLLPSSIIWYRPMGSDARQLGK